MVGIIKEFLLHDDKNYRMHKSATQLAMNSSSTGWLKLKMKKNMILKKYFLLLLLLVTTFLVYSQTDLSWAKNVGARKTPSSKEIYWVNDFGATNDTSKVTTKIIQRAIDKCAGNGGGIVVAAIAVAAILGEPCPVDLWSAVVISIVTPVLKEQEGAVRDVIHERVVRRQVGVRRVRPRGACRWRPERANEHGAQPDTTSQE